MKSNVPHLRGGLSVIFGTGILIKALVLILSCLTVSTATLQWYSMHSVHMFFFVTLTSWPRNECFRRVLLKCSNSEHKNHLLRLSHLITSVVTLLAGIYWIRVPPHIVITTNEQSLMLVYRCCVMVHISAALLTSMLEVLYLQLCRPDKFKAKNQIDAHLAILFSLSFSLPQLAAQKLGFDIKPHMVLFASGAAQLTWALGLLIMTRKEVKLSYYEALHQIRDSTRLPGFRELYIAKKKVEEENDQLSLRDLLELTWIEAKGSTQKWLITESDKILSMRYLSAVDQGAVAMAENLAGIVVRIFASLEDMLRIHYSQDTIANSTAPLKSYMIVFRSISYVEWGMALSASVFGPVFARSVLKLAYGKAIADYDILFGRYCALIALLGMAGVLDSFCNAAGPIEWQNHSRRLNRKAWIIFTSLAIILHESKKRSNLFGVTDLTVWLLTVGLNILSRCIISIKLIWEGLVAKQRGTNQWSSVVSLQRWLNLVALIFVWRVLVHWLVSRVSVFDDYYGRFDLGSLSVACIIGATLLWRILDPVLRGESVNTATA